MKICFLINRQMQLARAENRMYLGNAALALGHEPHFAFIDTLASHNGAIAAATTQVTKPLSPGDSFETMVFLPEKLDFDLVWVLGFGIRETYLDKIQLLKSLSQQTRVINSPDALFFLHSKSSQSGLSGLMRYPETHVSSDFKELWHIFQTGGDWIVKPSGESLGRDVFKLRAGDSNARAVLQSMTGHTATRYCLLQRYIEEVGQGEKRVLLAGGEVVGWYGKKAGIDHRGNLHQEAESYLCDLTASERECCERIGAYLLARGVVFAGLDIAGEWLLEWNVLNPGGIGTIERLSGKNLANDVILKLLNPSQMPKPAL